MRSLMTLVLMLVICIPSWGCADTKDTWTKGDREMNSQSLQGVRKQIKAIDALLPQTSGFLAMSLTAIRADLAIVELNLAKVEELHGPPPEVKPFNDKNSAAARNTATEEHSKRGFLGWVLLIGGYLSTAALVAAGVMNLPIVGPYLATTKAGQVAARVLSGKIVTMGLDAVKTISVARSQAEDKPLTAKDVVNLAVSTFSPSTAKIADKVSDQLEAKHEIEVTPIRQLAGTPS